VSQATAAAATPDGGAAFTVSSLSARLTAHFKRPVDPPERRSVTISSDAEARAGSVDDAWR
jgi:hypothetical protein